jgi:hypothetical protein
VRARLRAAREAWRARRARRARPPATVPGRLGGAAVVLLLTATLLVGVLAPPEHCPAVTRGDLRASATAAVGWFVRNQRPDGRWLYLYDRTTGEVDAEPYNVVRHAGAILGLEQAATAGIPGARGSADRGFEWMSRWLTQRDGWTAVSYHGEVAVGASALLVAALAERREATGATDRDELMRGLGRFLVAQVEPSGAVLAYYDIGTGRPVPGTYSKYYTGEAYWALARLHRLLPGGGWGEPADRVGHYLATERDDAEGHRLAIPDHWAAYGLAETVGAPAGPGSSEPAPAAGTTTSAPAEGAGAATDPAGRALTADERAYARHQAGAFGVQVRWFAQRFGPWGAVTRGFRGVPRGGGYGVVGEALSGLWRVARAQPELADVEGPVAERALCNAGQAIEAQSTRSDAAGYAEPARVAGAWFRGGETRMDDQQHMISALLRAEAIATTGRTGRNGPAPPAWLWLVVLVASLNPARTALGLRPAGARVGARPAAARPSTAPPVAGTGRRPPGDADVGDTALGALAGAATLLVAALLADRLASWWHVSPPALRLAAGALAIVGGLSALLTRPSPVVPAGTGRSGAAVAAAVAVVHPVLVVATLAAAVDRGLPVVALALVVGVTTTVGLVGATSRGAARDRPGPEGPRTAALVWAGRLTGVVLAVSGILLILDAAYAP